MIRPRSLAALAGGCALIAIVNAVILGGALRNRGETLASVPLTERELALPEFRDDASTSLVLDLRFAGQVPPEFARAAWRHGYTMPALDVDWFDAAKLRELGFAIDSGAEVAKHAHEHAASPERRACVALELDGDAWARVLAAREERVAAIRKEVDSGNAEPQTLADAEAALSMDRVMRSRLVPIDAAPDCDALRARHAGRERVLVLPAVVSAVAPGEGNDDAAWRGRIDFLLVAGVRVPGPLRPVLAPLLATETEDTASRREPRGRVLAWPTPVPPRYRATVAFGRSDEPWLVAVTPIP